MNFALLAEIIADSVFDSLSLFPFLFVTYLVLEYIERHAKEKSLDLIGNAGKWGPFAGGLAGLVPQCGFAAAAANFYAVRAISTGTLLAVLLSTSDEMLPIMFSNSVPFSVMAKVLGLKLIVGISAGVLCDIFWRHPKAMVNVESLCEQDDCHCENGNIAKPALKHTLKITLFIFCVTLVLNWILAVFDGKFIRVLVFDNPILGPIIAAFVGLVPNCSSSVVITQLWVDGVINFGSLFSGVLAGGGVGLLVLFRVNRNRRDNFKIMALLYFSAAISGIFAELLHINL